MNPVKLVERHISTARFLDILLKSPGVSPEQILASALNAKIPRAQKAGPCISREISFK